jgi:hypothetical protein
MAMYRIESASYDKPIVTTPADFVTEGGSLGGDKFLSGDGTFKSVPVPAYVIPPTDDPHVEGALWSDKGVLSVSAG